MRDVGSKAGLDDQNTRLSSGAIGAPESRLEVRPVGSLLPVERSCMLHRLPSPAGTAEHPAPASHPACSLCWPDSHEQQRTAMHSRQRSVWQCQCHTSCLSMHAKPPGGLTATLSQATPTRAIHPSPPHPYSSQVLSPQSISDALDHTCKSVQLTRYPPRGHTHTHTPGLPQMEVSFSSTSDWEAFLARIPGQEHLAWSQVRRRGSSCVPAAAVLPASAAAGAPTIPVLARSCSLACC